jgi:hypothetical protein
MKISLLVLVALACFSAAVSAKRVREENKFVNKDGYDVQQAKTITEDVQVYQEGDAIIEEETKVIRTSIEGKRKGKRKVSKWVEAEQQPCSVILADQAAECTAGCNEYQDCNFEILSEATCEWKCNCATKIVEITEESVLEESEKEGQNGEKRRRKVRKEVSGAGGKKKKGGKECSGTKKLSFSNCLLKIKGFVSWGDDARSVNEKWYM